MLRSKWNSNMRRQRRLEYTLALWFSLATLWTTCNHTKDYFKRLLDDNKPAAVNKESVNHTQPTSPALYPQTPQNSL